MKWLTGFPAGLIITLFVFGISACIIVFNRKIKKVTNCYWFWLFIAIGCLAYFISCRFAISWKEMAQACSGGYIPDGSTYSGAQIISRALLFDFCPFFGLVTPILLIVDPSRKAARSVAPILLLGTIFTCTAGFLTNSEMSLDPYFIFHGTKGWELYVGLHAVNMWLAVGILCNTPKFEFEGYLIMLGCILFFVVYVLVGKTITECKLATSGLSYQDWWYIFENGVKHPGTYYPITKIFGNNPYVAMGLTWPTEIALFSGIVALWDRVFKVRKWHAYGNARNTKRVNIKFGKKTYNVKQWWFWYDYNKFVEPKRFSWKPLNKVSLFFNKKHKFSITKNGKIK